MPVYFIRSEQIRNNRVEVEAELAHHLRTVLRLKVGESLALVDEHPQRYQTRVISTHPNPLVLEVEHTEFPPKTQSPTLHLGLAVLKGEKMDWIVQKATEIGLARLSPLLTERTVVQTRAERTARQHARWEKIAMEAAQQSCRWEIPQIAFPVPFARLLAQSRPDSLSLIFSPEPSAQSLKDVLRNGAVNNSTDVTLLVGPEGGFGASEIESALAAGFQPVSLGDTVLRSETAALAALSIVQYEMKHG